jgi:uncharacterized protein
VWKETKSFFQSFLIDKKIVYLCRMEQQQAQLICAAAEYDRGDARRIHHFLKVHDFAMTIAAMEQVDAATCFTLETAAILHDIGIHEAERKYGNSHGHYQEIEGPNVARAILKSVGGYSEEVTDRVCWLIAHHHHYNNIEGLDYQILVEADFLVNIMEDGMSADAIANVRQRVFKTPAGIRLLDALYPSDLER